MIEVNKIDKRYGKIKVLDDISFHINKNSITGIIGPNGAGKSTLIKIIAGFEFPDNGIISIKGERIEKFSQNKKYLSYMPENMMLYPDYFVEEFLILFHSIMNFKDEELLKKLSLEKVFNKKIGHLSKGWHQRLKLYIALSNNKPIVLLDEPFDGFDPLQMREIIKIFKSQNVIGRTFILSIHQLADAQKICDYFIFLDAGKKIAEGSIESLHKRYNCKSKSLEEIFLRAIGE